MATAPSRRSSREPPRHVGAGRGAAPRARATSACPVWPTASTIAAVVSFAASYLHVQALADEVGGDRLEAGKRLQPALEDDDLFVAVHALDAEHRFGVQLARRRRRPSAVAAITRPAAGLLDVPQPLPEERQDVLVVERVEDHPAVTPGPDDARVAQQAELVGHGRLGHAELGGEVADAQLGARQRVEDPHPGRVAEHAEDLGQALDGVRDQAVTYEQLFIY